MKKLILLILLFLPVVPLVADLESDLKWLSELERKESASVGDLVRIVSRSYKEERDKHTVAQWQACFEKLGWLTKGLKLDDPCTRGQLGKLIAGRLNLRGNTMLLWFGPSERYGFKEIVRLKFIRGGMAGQFLSGSVLMNAQSKSTGWIQSQGEDALKDFKKWTAASLKKGLGQ